KDQAIDLAAGVVLKCRVGHYIDKSQPLATIYSNDSCRLPEAMHLIQQAVSFDSRAVAPPPLILGFVDDNGFQDRLI
ncbi:MAG: pyrimidine-nucleoside phosphorylase, partial [Sporomusa sp.]